MSTSYDILHLKKECVYTIIDLLYNIIYIIYKPAKNCNLTFFTKPKKMSSRHLETVLSFPSLFFPMDNNSVHNRLSYDSLPIRDAAKKMAQKDLMMAAAVAEPYVALWR